MQDYVATHAYKASHTDELTFKAADTIFVMEKPDGGWWKGRTAVAEGWFPANHVRQNVEISSAAAVTSAHDDLPLSPPPGFKD
jgi:hypothetical protein